MGFRVKLSRNNKEGVPKGLVYGLLEPFFVTMDDFGNDNIEGVKHKHLSEFLLMDEY